MKTIQSFFPTRAKTAGSVHRDIHYNLIKKPTQQQSQSINKEQNIFRDKNNQIKKYSLEESIQRPVGGVEIFKKMQKLNNFMGIEESSKRLQRKSSKKNIKDSKQRIGQTSNAKQKICKFNSQTKNYQSEFIQQTYKAHDDHKEQYTKHLNIKIQKMKKKSQQMPQIYLQKSKTANVLQKYNKSRSSSVFKVQSQKKESRKASQIYEIKQNKWVTEQQKGYLDKMAILNQIYYNRPLIQKFGNKYFECILRNRFQDEPKPAQFIYQIKDKLAQSKFISKLKKYKPNLLERNKLAIQGHSKLKKQEEKKVRPKGKQRWQEWQDDDIQYS